MGWTQIFGIEIVDADGPLRKLSLNHDLITLDTFVEGIAECTICITNKDKHSVLDKLF